jgi:hypothetical protein
VAANPDRRSRARTAQTALLAGVVATLTRGSSTAVAQATDGPGLAAKALVCVAATIAAL